MDGFCSIMAKKTQALDGFITESEFSQWAGGSNSIIGCDIVKPLHATPLPPSGCCSFCFGLTRYGVALGTVCSDRAYDDAGWCCERDCVNVID
jgi:hypothetical protein